MPDWLDLAARLDPEAGAELIGCLLGMPRLGRWVRFWPQGWE